MLKLDLLNTLKQLAHTLDHNPHDIPALEEMIAEISSLLMNEESIMSHPDIKKVLRLLGMGVNRLGEEKALARFEKEGKSFAPPWEVSTDLDILDSPLGSAMAKSLRELLEEIQLDSINKTLRNPDMGGDYDYTPRSMEDSLLSRIDILRKVENELPTLEKENPELKRAYLAYLFFMEGRPISLENLQLIFGEERKNAIMSYFTSGLFVLNKKELAQMNSLALSSTTLGEKTIYILSDRTSEGGKSDRVYLGGDSWTFLNFLSRQNHLSGTGIDLGSGSGVQGIGCAMFHDAVEKVVLYEIDQRSRNVSVFNAVLNDVHEKVVIAADETDLTALLESEKASFVVTNPPFMPLPDFVELNEKISKGLPPEMLQQLEGRSGINLKDTFFKAGWGGIDGLSVIKDFLTLVEEIGQKGTQVFIFSPIFSVDSNGTYLLEKYAKHQKGWDFQFELSKERVIPKIFNKDFVNTVKYTKTDEASVMAEVLVGDLVEFLPIALHKTTFEFVKPIIEEGYDSLEIHEFHNGIAIITLTGSPSHINSSSVEEGH